MADRDYLSSIQFLWEFGNSNEKITTACKNKLKNEILDSTVLFEGMKYHVSGYVGTVALPAQLKTDSETSNNTITIMSNGRIFEDILSAFDSARMFTNYLVGEIEMNFLDDNELPDMATSSRQQLQQNDPRYNVVTSFIQTSLNKIDKKWDEWRRKLVQKKSKKKHQY